MISRLAVLRHRGYRLKSVNMIVHDATDRELRDVAALRSKIALAQRMTLDRVHTTMGIECEVPYEAIRRSSDVGENLFHPLPVNSLIAPLTAYFARAPNVIGEVKV